MMKGMRGWVVVCWVVLVWALVGVHSAEYYLGGGDDGLEVGANAVIQTGATHVRVYLLWKYIQPRVEDPLEKLTVAQLRNDSAAIDAWALRQDWRDHDRRLSFYRNTSVKVIAEVTEGTTNGLPAYRDTVFDPNVVGEQLYLAYVYRAARATVRRYKRQVHMWQIENELNEAWLASVGGQRRFQFFGSAWSDWQFLTEVLQTCRMAVKDEDSSAIVTMNFQTDVAAWVHDTLLLKGYYEDAIREWHSLMDIVSIDAYPNNFVSYPCESNVVAERVQKSRAAAPNMSVFIMEWSYPIGADGNSNLPLIANFSNANQIACMNQTYAAVKNAGGLGIMYFKFAEATGIVPPPGGYTQLDLDALKLIRLMMTHNEDPLYLLEWLASGLHLDYLEHRLPLLLSSYGQGFGLIMPNGTARPGLYELRSIFKQWK